jgi:hypothetical protein
MGAITEVYLGMTGASVTLDGTTLAVIDGSYTIEAMSDEMTNTTSAGWFEDVNTINKVTGDMTLAYKTANLPTYVEGSVYTLISSVTSGPYLSGNVRLNKVKYPGVSPKQGVKLEVSWTNQGPMTRTRPT